MATMLEVVRRAVQARVPIDEREADSQRQMLAALDRLADPFDQQADSTHVTGSAVIVGPRGVVLHLHRRLGIWLQPGGHLEPGEAPWDAARREATEETGLQVRFSAAPGGGAPELLHLDVHPGGRGHTHLDLRYLMTVAGDETPAPPPGESQQVRWFPWPEALSVADPGLACLLEALRPETDA